MKLLLRWIVLTISIWVVAATIPGIHVSGGVKTYLWIALVFGLINAILGNVIKVLTFPLSLITFGLFLLVINAGMLALTAKWTKNLTIDGFWSAFFGALVISIIGQLLSRLIKKVKL
jgi:putative membrane protein